MRRKKGIVAVAVAALVVLGGASIAWQASLAGSSDPSATHAIRFDASRDTSGIQVSAEAVSIEDIPGYDGYPYIVINGNIPAFTEDELASDTFEEYGSLDDLGRCTQAFALVGKETMPTEKRGNISGVHPTGWHNDRYTFVDGDILYNRCHLLGFQLTGENANKNNLITGTRYMNVQGMLPFEEDIASYVRETGDHVLYRVTPIFEGDDLLAQGVQMEAFSVEDDGAGICFNVFCYNVQPGVIIDYATGDNHLAEDVGISGAHYGMK